MKRKVFLRWLLLMVGLINVLVVIFLLGLHTSILATGVGTAIVCIISALFFLTSLRTGVDSFKLSTVLEKSSSEVKEDRDEAKSTLKSVKGNLLLTKFVSGLSMGLGMFGTVCGLIMMFSGIDQNIDPSNYQANIQLLKVVSAGFGVALYTTLAGLASSILLAIQAFNIEFEVRKNEDE